MVQEPGVAASVEAATDRCGCGFTYPQLPVKLQRHGTHDQRYSQTPKVALKELAIVWIP